MTRRTISRRAFVRSWLALPASVAVLAPLRGALGESGLLPLTRECGGAESPTRAQTAGPFFTPDTPLKRDFRAGGLPGEPITLLGLVVDRACNPVPNAPIELWHADDSGDYDNRGYRFRGHQFSDDQGRYAFDTIVPGLYPGRTRHFHVKVQPATGPLLTTQLYFPGEPHNARDAIFHDSLLLRIDNTADGKVGRFDFVVRGA